MGRSLQTLGTNALYAYEARAGVFFDRGLLATQDVDVLWDSRPMSTPPIRPETLSRRSTGRSRPMCLFRLLIKTCPAAAADKSPAARHEPNLI
jgi:hypothetical protein